MTQEPYDGDGWWADDDPNWGDNPERPIGPNPGSEFDPANFVGRREETRQAAEKLQGGQNLLLSDPRRLGKTFWMLKFAEQMEKLSLFHVIWIDYEQVTTIEGLLAETVKKLVAYKGAPAKFLNWAGGLFDIELTGGMGPFSVTLNKAASGFNALDHLERIFTKFDQEIQQCDRIPLVIAMDEVPDAIRNIISYGTAADGRNVLQTLQHLRRSMTHVRWIVAGSVGFHHVLPLCGGTQALLGDLNVLPFGPLDPLSARALIRRLCLDIGRKINDDALVRMVHLTDGMPYLIQALCDQARWKDGRRTTDPITPTDVSALFEIFLANRDLSHAVSHFFTRIELVYGKADAVLAHQILAWAAQDPPGWRSLDGLPDRIRKNPRFVAVLHNLIDDHYLVQRGHAVTWRYEVIRVIYRYQAEA